jgi:hypothetical protein
VYIALPSAGALRLAQETVGQFDGHGVSLSCWERPDTRWVLKIGPQWREARKL